MKKLLSAAFAVFFMSFAAFAQDVPRAKPDEKSAPACVMISDFFKGVDHIALNHRNYPDLMFGYAAEYKVIVVFLMENKCILAYEMVTQDSPEFEPILEHVFSGWLAGWGV